MRNRGTVLSAGVAAAMILLGGQTAQAQVTPTDAAAFLGDWTATLEGPQGSIDLGISIAAEDGTLAGSVTGPQGAPSDIEAFSMSGNDLVMTYTIDFGGQSAPVQITLSPNGDAMDFEMSFGGGGGPGPIGGTAVRN